MKQLETSIFQLKTNQHWAVKVEAKSPNGSYSVIENNIQKAALETKFGTIENFFEDLNKRGLTEIRITDRKSNGSVFKTISIYELKFENGNPTEINQNVQTIQPAPVINYNPAVTPLNGMANGLGMVEIHRIHDYDRVVKDNIKLESKVENLTNENEKLKEINLRQELLGVKKVENTESQAKLMTSASAYIPLVQAFLMGNRGIPPTPGLGAPLSPIKEKFVAIDDYFLQDLLPVLTGMQNEDFDNELSQLLVKYNLISA